MTEKGKLYKHDNILVRVVGGVDRQFLGIIILFLCIGSVMVLSASYVYAKEYEGDSYYYAKKQLIFVILGLAAMVFSMNFDYNKLRKYSLLIFGAATVMLMLVLVIGKSGGGAQRWIYIGPVSVQPSEIMKFAVILLSADYIDKYSDKIKLRGQPKSMTRISLPFLFLFFAGAVIAVIPFVIGKVVQKLAGSTEQYLEDGSLNKYFSLYNTIKNMSALLVIAGIALIIFSFIFAKKKDIVHNAPDFVYGVFPFACIIALVGGLLIAQPHLSGLIIICTLVLIMMTVGGSSLKYISTAVAFVGGLMLMLMKIFPHASKRLMVWSNPFDYLKDDGWQPAQSLYAIGNGGLWGVGLGNSRQKHLYLPEPQNDYIFAILCEELGFIGALIVICMFVFFVYRGIKIAFRAPDRFSALLVTGIVSQVGLQALLNMMVVTNTIPSTGISLPFFSYGGSSLFILMCEMGVVLSVSRYSILEKK